MGASLQAAAVREQTAGSQSEDRRAERPPLASKQMTGACGIGDDALGDDARGQRRRRGQLPELPGKRRRGCSGDSGGGHGTSFREQSERREVPRGDTCRGEVARKAFLELGGERAVLESPRDLLSRVGTDLVSYDHRRGVPCMPPCLVEPPDEIDVLAESRILVEAGTDQRLPCGRSGPRSARSRASSRSARVRGAVPCRARTSSPRTAR